MITNGSLQGFLFVMNAFGGGRVVVEAPTYDCPLKRLGDLGAEVATVPVDDEGADVEALAQELERGQPSFAYVISTFRRTRAGRRLLARRHRLAELKPATVSSSSRTTRTAWSGSRWSAPPTVFELAGGRNVIYASSFSKTVAPGVRVGYMVPPENLAAPVGELAVSTYISPATIGQATVLEFIARGRFDENLARVAAGLARAARCDARGTGAGRAPGATEQAVRRHFLWLDLPGTDTGELLARAEAGVAFVAGRDFFPLARARRVRPPRLQRGRRDRDRAGDRAAARARPRAGASLSPPNPQAGGRRHGRPEGERARDEPPHGRRQRAALHGTNVGHGVSPGSAHSPSQRK